MRACVCMRAWRDEALGCFAWMQEPPVCPVDSLTQDVWLLLLLLLILVCC